MMAVSQQFHVVSCWRVSSVMHACMVGRLWEYVVVSEALFESVRLFYGSVCAVYVPHVFLD